MTLQKIKLNAIVIVCIIITIPFLFLGFYNYSISKIEIHNKIVNSSIPLLRNNIYSEIEKSFIPGLRVASVMSKDSFLINWVTKKEHVETDSIIQFLAKIKSEFNYRTTFFVSSESLVYYHYEGIYKKLSRENEHDQWYYNFLESGLEYDLDVDFDEVLDNQLTIFINYRVHGFNGKLLGVTGIGIEMQNFSNFLIDQQIKYNRSIYLVDRYGVIQAHSDLNTIERSNILDMEGINSVATELLNNKNDPSILNYKLNGEDILVSSKYIEDIDWFLIVTQNETEALKIPEDNLRRTIIAGIILLLTILPIIILILNFFSQKMEILAVTDPLTGTYNRREFNRLLTRAIDRKTRSGYNVTLIAIDIDFFKKINDSYGHQFGDLILKELTEKITTLKRPNDILSRLGGDEFVILIEGSELEGINLSERIKEFLISYTFRYKKDRGTFITLSMGVYEASNNETPETIMNKSDKALYSAKNSGRNTIKTYN